MGFRAQEEGGFIRLGHSLHPSRVKEGDTLINLYVFKKKHTQKGRKWVQIQWVGARVVRVDSLVLATSIFLEYETGSAAETVCGWRRVCGSHGEGEAISSVSGEAHL